MRPTTSLAAVLAVVFVAGAALFSAPPRALGADDDTEAPLDYAFYKARIAPILHGQCAECHADPRKRSKVGKFFLQPAPGRRLRERFHERNFERVLAYVEPGDPSASLLLLKVIGPRNGGVTHESAATIGVNTPEYGAIVDWINGEKQPVEAFKPPIPEPGQPDFLFFFKRIEPVLLGVCAECHEGRGKGRFKLVTHERGEPFPIEDHHANFQTVLTLLEPEKPLTSRFLLKPLAVQDGGLKHKGGDRFGKDSVNYENWVQFLQGEQGPPLPTPGVRVIPEITAQAISLQAEDFDFEGDLDDAERKGAESFYVAVPGAEGGRLVLDMRVVDAGPYVMELRVQPGTVPLRWGFEGEDGEPLQLPPAGARDEHGFALTRPERLLDGPAPLVDARGELVLDGKVMRMDGRRGEAAWLSPSDTRNSGCVARLRMADEEEGGDDAFVLFDMDDGWNGKFVGLADGGRRFVMGVLEGGRARVLQSAKAHPPELHHEAEPREIKVETFGGVAVGSLDGRPLAFLNLSGNLGRGRFGVLTHGLAEVRHMAALEEYEVYQVAFSTGPVIDLPAGRQRLWIDLPVGGGAVDALHLRPSTN